MPRGIRFLPALGAGTLTLAHLLARAAFRRMTREILTRLENMAAAEVQAAPVPALIEYSASRAVGRNPVPRAVWLRQTGEMRTMPNAWWRLFTAEQVISIHTSGFAWLARMQAMPLLSAHILDCYVDGEGLLEARLCGSLPLARGAGQEGQQGRVDAVSRRTDMGTARDAAQSQLSWREIDASTVEVSAASPGGPVRVRLIFEDRHIARIEADDRPRTVGRRIVPTRWAGCCGDYREMEGCRVPTRAAVSWLLDDGPFEYWRGKVTAYGMRRL